MKSDSNPPSTPHCRQAASCSAAETGPTIGVWNEGSSLLRILTGDCREILPTIPNDSIQCCVTSPPYWGLRDYGVQTQMGLEETPEQFIAGMVEVFREVRRALKPDGTCWVNIGDSYCGAAGGFQGKNGQRASRTHTARVKSKLCEGMKAKDLVGIPWMLAFALRADGWYLRQEIIWSKPNPMPESVTDRCTKAHESIFLLTKSPIYYFDAEAIKEQSICGHGPGNNTHKAADAYAAGDKLHRTKAGLVAYSQKVRESKAKGSFQGKTEEMSATGQNAFRAVTETRNKRSVWTVPSAPFKEAHFATYPPDLIKPCILAGSRPGDTILDPFFGSGTTGAVALELGRRAVGIELNPSYVAISRRRTNITPGLAL